MMTEEDKNKGVIRDNDFEGELHKSNELPEFDDEEESESAD